MAVACWSAGNVIVKRIEVSGLHVAFHRVLLAAVIYLVIFYARGDRLHRSLMRHSAVPGVVFGLEIAAFFLALKETTIANTTVAIALQPILLLAVASRRFGEAIERRLVVVLIVAFAGVALVVFGSSSSAAWSPRGDLLAIVAVTLWAAYFVAAKAARVHVGAFELQTASLLFSVAVLAPIAFVDDVRLGSPSASQYLMILVLVFVPGTGHLLMNWAHAYLRLSRSSLLTLGVPVLSTAGAALFLDESVVAAQVAGMAVVLGCIAYIVNRDAGARTSAQVPAE